MARKVHKIQFIATMLNDYPLPVIYEYYLKQSFVVFVCTIDMQEPKSGNIFIHTNLIDGSNRVDIFNMKHFK